MKRASVVRVVGDELIYLQDGGETVTFTPEVIEGYDGSTLVELNLVQGQHVSYEVEPTTRKVLRVLLPGRESKSTFVEQDLKGFSIGKSERFVEQDFKGLSTGTSERQEDNRSDFGFKHGKGEKFPQETMALKQILELTPDTPPSETTSWKANRAIEPRVREFGKFIATDSLWPGDLVLTREMGADFISEEIRALQRDAGYSDPTDSIWTHAAMYVGDGQRLIEATFETVLGGKVQIANIDHYCGAHGIRVRRSKFISSEREGWLMVIRAMAKIGTPYAMLEGIKHWWNLRIKKKGFWLDERQYRTGDAVVCSTLYADAYNETTRRSLGELNGVCFPAWLSQTDEFHDLPLQWLRITR